VLSVERGRRSLLLDLNLGGGLCSRFTTCCFQSIFSSGCQALAPTVRTMVEVWSVEVTLLHVIDDERRLGGRHELERLHETDEGRRGRRSTGAVFWFPARSRPAGRPDPGIRPRPIPSILW